MVRYILSTGLFLALSTVGFAAVDPNAPIPSAVVDECTAADAGQEVTGLCVGATKDFITALQAKGVTGSDLDTQIIDLTTQLATLAAGDKACNDTDGEIAQAIALASGYISDPAQKQALVELSDTVAACAGGETGDLPDQISPV